MVSCIGGGDGGDNLAYEQNVRWRRVQQRQGRDRLVESD